MKRQSSIFFSESKACSILKCQLLMMKYNFTFDGGVQSPVCFFKRRFKDNGMLSIASEFQTKTFINKYLLN